MHDDLQIHDLHRVLGPVPHDESPTPDAASLRADLASLGVASGSAVASGQLYGDPSVSWDDLGPDEQADGVLSMVPVIVPAAAGGGWPAGPDELVGLGARLVRACPVRHRWDLTSAVAGDWWGALAASGIAVSVDVTEVGFGAVAALAGAFPDLTVVALNPGYRELRRTAALLAERGNVVVETGTLNTAGAVEWLAGAAGADRLVFGTGGPLADDAGATWLLRHLDLPRADVERIAAGTARELLGVAA
ncbi:amidohydrolase family protein [Propionibacteriaceae bacterium G1746]